MAELQDAPYIRLLLAMAATLTTVDYQDVAGLVDLVTVRHARTRKPVRSERPALTLIFVGDDEQPAEQQRNMGETVRALDVDLQADIELFAEDSGLDPTGLGKLAKVLAAGVQAMQDPNSAIAALTDYIILGAVDPDEKNSDDGRLVRSLTVLYRVRSDDANVLLAAGDNA